MLEDIAILTGGQVISEDLGIKLENVKIGALGSCKIVKIDKESGKLASPRSSGVLFEYFLEEKLPN